MDKLQGRVLELFLKDKKENKITNIVYGKKALDKYVDASFKNRDEKELLAAGAIFVTNDYNKIDKIIEQY